jgi:hypothetical protein
MDGGGVPLFALDENARFQMDVRTIATANGATFRGKVRFREGGLFLRSVQITSAVPVAHPVGETGGHFTVDGLAICTDAGVQPTHFHLEADDNGPGQLDNFTLECDFSPVFRDSTLAKGDLRFRQQVGS